MVRGIANSKIGFGDLILLLRYFFKLKVSTHPNVIDSIFQLRITCIMLILEILNAVPVCML